MGITYKGYLGLLCGFFVIGKFIIQIEYSMDYEADILLGDLVLRNNPVCKGKRSPNITVCFETKDQLGNQMFQYASSYCFSKINNFSLYVEETIDISEVFKLSAIHVDRITLRKTCNEGEKHNGFVQTRFSPRFLHATCSRNITIQGYMQCYANFKECTDEIIEEFTFKNEYYLRSRAESLILKSTKYRYSFQNKIENEILLIAIHVRRGDYIGKSYPVAHAQYFIDAMEHFRVKFGHQSVFVVMTNSDGASRKWCHDNIVRNSANTFLLDADSASVHLYILSNSDHVIISMGTYGWWGAFLNRNASVVKWNVFYKLKKYRYSEFYPANWIIMEGERLGDTQNEHRKAWGGM